jgi:hypothetical protein
LKKKYFQHGAEHLHGGEGGTHDAVRFSVDAFGKRAEYIRHGLDFDRMMTNVEEFLDRIPVRNSITFICTYNNLSITSMDRLLEKILELRKKYSKDIPACVVRCATATTTCMATDHAIA